MLDVFFKIFYFEWIFLLANSEDSDQKPRSAASDLGLHYLPMSQKWDARVIWFKDTYEGTHFFNSKMLFKCRYCETKCKAKDVQHYCSG